MILFNLAKIAWLLSWIIKQPRYTLRSKFWSRVYKTFPSQYEKNRYHVFFYCPCMRIQLGSQKTPESEMCKFF